MEVTRTCTIHKVQGLSLNNGVISFGLERQKSFNQGQIYACRPAEMKKILGGSGVYPKTLTKLVSCLRRSFNGNRLKCLKILSEVVVDNENFQHKQIFVKFNANSQHKQIFVKYFCGASSQSLQTFQLTASLEFKCRFLVFYC